MLTASKRSRTDGDSLDMFKSQPDKGRFYTLESLDATKKLSSLNPFVIKRSIEGISVDIDICKTKKRRDGLIVLKAKNEFGNVAISGIKKFAEIEVSVKDFLALNCSQGLIYCPELIDTPCVEIVEGLNSQGVTNAFKINKKGSISPTPLIILTFNNRIHPASVVVGYTIIEVRKYIQNPMRCLNCQKFGHTKKFCKESEVCGKCSIPISEHTECADSLCSTCSGLIEKKHYLCGLVKCVNCHGAHYSSDHDCPNFKREYEINKIKIDRCLTYFEAKKVFDQTNSSAFSGLFSNNQTNGNINNNELNNIVATLSKKLDNEIENNKKRELKLNAFIERQEETILKLGNVIKSKDLKIDELEKKLIKYKKVNKTLVGQMSQITGFEAQVSSNHNSSFELSEDENELDGSACSVFEDDESMVVGQDGVDEYEDITGSLNSLIHLNQNV